MSDVRTHLIRYPNARTSTVRYLQEKDEKTRQLMQEILDEQRRRAPRPWWQRLLERLR